MKITIIDPPNHNAKAGFYLFRLNSKIEAVGLRLPFTRIDLRLWIR